MQRQTEQLLEGVPSGLLDLINDAEAACVAIYALWFSFVGGAERHVTEVTGEYEEAVRALQPTVDCLDAAQRTLLFDLALEHLAQLPAPDRQLAGRQSLGQANAERAR